MYVYINLYVFINNYNFTNFGKFFDVVIALKNYRKIEKIKITKN